MVAQITDCTSPDAPTRAHFLETVFPMWRERERVDPGLVAEVDDCGNTIITPEEV